MVTKSGVHYVYIVQCKDGTLYTGYTNDLKHRLEKHNSGQGAKYTQGRGPVKLVYNKYFRSYSKALKAEWEIKKLIKRKKRELIQNKAKDI